MLSWFLVDGQLASRLSTQLTYNERIDCKEQDAYSLVLELFKCGKLLALSREEETSPLLEGDKFLSNPTKRFLPCQYDGLLSNGEGRVMMGLNVFECCRRLR